MTEKKKNIQMHLKGSEITTFEKSFKASTFRSKAEFMRHIFFTYLKIKKEK